MKLSKEQKTVAWSTVVMLVVIVAALAIVEGLHTYILSQNIDFLETIMFPVDLWSFIALILIATGSVLTILWLRAKYE